MKRICILTAMLVFLTGVVRADQSYKDYDTFYTNQPGTLFTAPIPFDANAAYSTPGEQGIYTQLQAKLENKAIAIELAENRITINGKAYLYSSATTFPGEHSSNIYPLTDQVFLVSRTNVHPDLLCLQGNSDGSGEADRHAQIYLLIDPLATQHKRALLHLPSLLSSCRAIVKTKDGKLAFPNNSYIFDHAQASRIGLLMTYYTFTDGRFIPIGKTIRLQFVQPEIPFQFSIQNEN